MTIEPLTSGDAPRWAAFTAALVAADLPADNLTEHGQSFFSFENGAAFGGFARGGKVALLRSIVVAPEHRGQGLGSRALEGLLATARGQHVEEAWLLTTTAEAFFTRHGFTTAQRASAPPFIAASAQFASLCPASAVLMCRKPL